MISIKKVAVFIHKYLGVDDSIVWATINKGFGIIKAPVSIYFLLEFLSVQEQGLWYTFTSLGALTMLADLGFTSIITQFVSHEYANLYFSNGAISGESNKVDRLMGLIKFSISFYLKIIVAAIAILALIGLFYFKTEATSIYFAWFAFSITGGMGLLVCLFQTIYQGLDKIKAIQINLLFNSFAITLFTCLALFFHLKIWALVIGSFVGVIVTGIGLYIIAQPFWKQILSYKVKGDYTFFKETFPLQVRYAVSFISSYFISFLFVPATYKFVGAVAAGQLGVTLSIVAVISGISTTWLFTKVPKFNMCVSRKQYHELDSLFKRSVIQGLFIQILLSVLFIAALFIVQVYFAEFSSRFLNVKLSILFLAPQIVQFIITGLTLYLRAFKKEPLMWLQILNAILIICAVFAILYRGIGMELFFYSLNAISWIVLLPVAWVIFRKKRLDFIYQ